MLYEMSHGFDITHISDGLAFQGYFVFSSIIIVYIKHVSYRMYTLHITWPELDEYSIMDNVETLLMSCVSQWVVMHFPNFKGRLHICRVLCLQIDV